MKSDIRFKWTCIALLAIAVMLYAFDSRYKEVQQYGNFGGKSALWDTWTNSIIVFGDSHDRGKLVKYRIELENDRLRLKNGKLSNNIPFYKETPEDNRYQAFVVLSRDGYNLGTFSEMEQALQEGAKNRRFTYNALRKEGYNVGSYPKFKRKLGLTLWQRWMG